MLNGEKSKLMAVGSCPSNDILRYTFYTTGQQHCLVCDAQRLI